MCISKGIGDLIGDRDSHDCHDRKHHEFGQPVVKEDQRMCLVLMCRGRVRRCRRRYRIDGCRCHHGDCVALLRLLYYRKGGINKGRNALGNKSIERQVNGCTHPSICDNAEKPRRRATSIRFQILTLVVQRLSNQPPLIFLFLGGSLLRHAP